MKLNYSESFDGLYYETGLTSNMEDYMETIAILSTTNRVVRVKDIARKLNIKMPSVTAALNKLKNWELIQYEKYSYIELTEKGITMAQRVFKKHSCLFDFFHSVLALEINTANAEACKVEHDLDTDTFKRLHLFLRFFQQEQDNARDWITKLHNLLKQQ